MSEKIIFIEQNLFKFSIILIRNMQWHNFFLVLLIEKAANSNLLLYKFDATWPLFRRNKNPESVRILAPFGRLRFSGHKPCAYHLQYAEAKPKVKYFLACHCLVRVGFASQHIFCKHF